MFGIKDGESTAVERAIVTAIGCLKAVALMFLFAPDGSKETLELMANWLKEKLQGGAHLWARTNAGVNPPGGDVPPISAANPARPACGKGLS